MILRIRDSDGNVQEILAIRGEDGKDGKDGAAGADGKDGVDGANGRDGVDGKDYVLTEADKQEIATMVVSLLQNGDEVSY